MCLLELNPGARYHAATVVVPDLARLGDQVGAIQQIDLGADARGHGHFGERDREAATAEIVDGGGAAVATRRAHGPARRWSSR